MTLLAIALAPILFLIILIYKKDTIQKEPKSELAKAFFGGAILVVAATVILTSFILPEIWGNATEWENPWLSLFGQAFLEAAIPEEVFKFTVLFYFVWKNKHFDEQFDGIVYAVFVSLGFACTENLLYVLDGDTATGYLRAITAVPGHFLFAVIMGYYFSLAKFNTDRAKPYLFKSLCCAILVHGIYDGIVMSIDALNIENGFLILGICVLFIAFIIKLWKIALKRMRELSPTNPALPSEQTKK